MEEVLIAGFMSRNMWRGQTPHYGFYLTTDRIIGVKGFFGGNFSQGEWNSELEAELFTVGHEFIGSPVAISTDEFAGQASEHPLSRDDAVKAVDLLEHNKDIEVSKQDIQELRIQKNKGGLKKLFGGWGKVIIRKPDETCTIKIGGEVTESEVQRLEGIFTAFDKDRFVIEEK